MDKKIPVWIDTDCGVDDALAIVTALKMKELAIVGLSSVAGNAEHRYTYRNTRNVVALAGYDIPVYKGAEQPLMIELETAAHVHGEDGLGGAIIPESKAKEETEYAWDALYHKAEEYGGELVVCAVGPLTNIAITIAKYPDFVKKIKCLNIMGGTIAKGGNVSPVGEFNIYVDPHAAEVCFKSGVHINVFGLDVTTECYLSKADFEEIVAYGNPISKLINDAMTFYLKNYHEGKKSLICMHDSCPLLYLAYPQWFTGYDCGVHVETRGGISFGKTLSDLYCYTKFPEVNATVFMSCQREKIVAVVKKLLAEY